MKIKAKEILNNIDKNCECEVQEQINNVKGSKIKGYSLSEECNYCKDKRVAQNLINNDKNKKDRKLQLQNRITQLSLEKDKASSLGFSELVIQKTNEINIAIKEVDTIL